MTSSKPQYERITVEDVQVGDRIARTRTEGANRVESIDEGPTTRRLHFGHEDCPQPPLKTAPHNGNRYCPGCHRWVNSGDNSKAIVTIGHGQTGGGNIRPRRTAKLWRVVA
jgi:hypothetical protein